MSLKLELVALQLTLLELYVVFSSVNTLDKCIFSALAFSSSVETTTLLPCASVESKSPTADFELRLLFT